MPTRTEMGQSLNLSLMMIDAGRRNRPGSRMRPTSITIHNTDNTDRGADASAHGRFVTKTGHYVHNGKKHWVSWHYSVDDGEVVKHLPIHEVAYHAGRSANTSSIAIEICMNAGIDQPAADDRAARLVAVLLFDLGMDADDVRTHKSWTGKTCPRLLVGSSTAWNAFVGSVRTHLASIVADAVPLSPGADSFAADLAELGDGMPFSIDGVSDEVREAIDNDLDHSALEAAMQQASD